MDDKQGHPERGSKILTGILAIKSLTSVNAILAPGCALIMFARNARVCLLYPVETWRFWALWLSFQRAALGRIFDAIHYIKDMCLRRPLRVTQALMAGA